jgi:hypothetical protein
MLYGTYQILETIILDEGIIVGDRLYHPILGLMHCH